ncbi:hypothetical protein [Desulfurococcus amylolyticus]|uniref:hypothetical protein n=1 Tax=Desulfurococcus TaxID=2273 RepID=UPI0023F423E8|nr:hypothetical protein [Desulfurococcus amylolyticus]
MSYIRASIVRWFEEIAEKTMEKLKSTRKGTLPTLMSSLTNIGDVVFPYISHLTDVLSRRLNKLQFTMIESMLLASLWFGFIAILLVIVTILLG